MRYLKSITLFAAIAVLGASVGFAQPGDKEGNRGGRRGNNGDMRRGGPGGGFRGDISKLRHVDSLTSLTAEQKTKLDELAKSSQEKFTKVREELRDSMQEARKDGAEGMEKSRELYQSKVRPVVDEIDGELKKILTPAQYTELEKKAESDRSAAGGRGAWGNRPGGENSRPNGGEGRGEQREGRGGEAPEGGVAKLALLDKLTSISVEQKGKLEKLSTETREKLRKARQEVREAAGEAKEATGDAAKEGRKKVNEAYQEKIKPVLSDLDRDLKSILTGEQVSELEKKASEAAKRFRNNMENRRGGDGQRGQGQRKEGRRGPNATKTDDSATTASK